MSYSQFVDDLPISLVGSLAISCGLRKPNMSGSFLRVSLGIDCLGCPELPLVYHDFSCEHADLVNLVAIAAYGPCSNRPKLDMYTYIRVYIYNIYIYIIYNIYDI